MNEELLAAALAMCLGRGTSSTPPTTPRPQDGSAELSPSDERVESRLRERLEASQPLSPYPETKATGTLIEVEDDE